ncbi:MAG TPA: carboxymuconolactone decarboxylase family protein [Candidatus Paceibacterota bacterium]|jgi:uncharacterized peroxidase-related enzyme|nr:carboxymuconolactone decarboxylase family protein [Candidatus Paceibacterota bacterium]
MITRNWRAQRASQKPIVPGLADLPGILAAMQLSPKIREHLAGLADELLAADQPGMTMNRGERELIATAVSAGNECVYCADTHGAFALELLKRGRSFNAQEIVSGTKLHDFSPFSAKMRALIHIALKVRERALSLTEEDVNEAIERDASPTDVQFTVLIAAAFCMYNRCVDGLRARTPESEDAYTARALEIADHGYASAKTCSVPQ